MTIQEIQQLKRVEVKRPVDFIFGGKSEFSIWNTNSGTKYDYKISSIKGKDYFFVHTQINGDMLYAGYLRPYNGSFYYNKGKKGILDVNAPQIRGIMYCLSFGNNPVPLPMCMTHHGKCAKCGRSLKDAVSVERGFGPDCWQTLNAATGYIGSGW